jgi:hypothetical protein
MGISQNTPRWASVICLQLACLEQTNWAVPQMSEMKVNEVVRNKEQREAMKASACEQCELFYASVLFCLVVLL